MRLPGTAHTSRRWRIHELAPDFRLEDVWELPGRGSPKDFHRLVWLIAAQGERLPEDLRDGPSGPDFDALPFTPLYLTDDEFAAEVANRTMHGVMHLGRVLDRAGGCRAQMAVLVKPNGLLGTAYMSAIRPFRRLIVYPAGMREGRELRERAGERTPAHA